MTIRAWLHSDAPAVELLLSAAWGHDPTALELFSIHGPDNDEPGAVRRTLVAEREGRVIGVGTLWEYGLHPARWRLTLTAQPDHRRRGIGSLLIDRLTAIATSRDARPLQAATRASDVAGRHFLEHRGFQVMMRTRLGMLDPRALDPATWQALEAATAQVAAAGYRVVAMPDLPSGPETERALARLHAEVYRLGHAWNPPAPLAATEARRLFLGNDLIPTALFAVVVDGDLIAVGSLRRAGELTEVELGWIGAAEHHQAWAAKLTAALLDRCLHHAADHGWFVRLEVDEADQYLLRLLGTLPVAWEPDWLTFVRLPPPPIGRP